MSGYSNGNGKLMDPSILLESHEDRLQQLTDKVGDVQTELAETRIQIKHLEFQGSEILDQIKNGLDGIHDQLNHGAARMDSISETLKHQDLEIVRLRNKEQARSKRWKALLSWGLGGVGALIMGAAGKYSSHLLDLIIGK